MTRFFLLPSETEQTSIEPSLADTDLDAEALARFWPFADPPKRYHWSDVSLQKNAWTAWDSPECLLHQAGISLRSQADEWYWSGPDSQSGGWQQDYRDTVWLPEPGSLPAKLAKPLDLRALFALANVAELTLSRRLLNSDEKTVAHLRLAYRVTQYPFSSQNNGVEVDHKKVSAAALTQTYLCLQPLLGYSKAAQKLEQLLLSEGATALPSELEVMVRPMLNAARPRKLSPDLALRPALQGLLIESLEGMQSHQQGLLADWDSEFLHDYRVNLRRSRSLLKAFKKDFREPTMQRFKADLKWLSELTTPVRDADVYQMDLAAWCRQADVAAAHAMLPLSEFLAGQRQKHFKAMSSGLKSDRYQAFIQDWRHYLETTDLASSDDHPHDDENVYQQARKGVWKAYQRVVESGRQISDESPEHDLHDLRLLCKQLRYLLDFFLPLFAAEDVTWVIKVLKKLQTLLGNFQDCSVQRHTLRDQAQALFVDGKAGVETYMAIGHWDHQVILRQQQLRREFSACYKAFDTDDLAQHVAHLCGRG